MNRQTLAICGAILGAALIVALVVDSPSPSETLPPHDARYAELAEAIRTLRDVIAREPAPSLHARGSADADPEANSPAATDAVNGAGHARPASPLPTIDPANIEELGSVDPVLFSSVWAGSERALLSDRKLEVTMHLLKTVSVPRKDNPTHAVYMRVLEHVDSANSLDSLRGVLMRYPLLFRSGDLHSYVESR